MNQRIVTTLRQPELQRRLLLRGLALSPLALAAASLLSSPARGQGGALLPTPGDDWGPFYPLDWAGDIDTDLTRFAGAAAEGTPLLVSGRVLAANGAPLPATLVEIWQADARGLYRHPGVPEALRDPGFQGFGRTLTGADGEYAFTTVMPGRYATRPPHIHFRVARSGIPEFVTQMYFRGDNREGGPNGRLPRGREALSVALQPLAAGVLAARFEIVLGRG